MREGGWGTLIENVVRFCGKIMLQLLSTANIYDHLTASKTTLGNPVPIIVVIWKDVQIPQMRYLVTFEIFRGTQEIGVEMVDGTEDLWDTRALLEQQLEVSLDTPNSVELRLEIIGEKSYSLFSKLLILPLSVAMASTTWSFLLLSCMNTFFKMFCHWVWKLRF